MDFLAYFVFNLCIRHWLTTKYLIYLDGLFQLLRKGVRRKADPTTPTNANDQSDYDPTFEAELKINMGPGAPQRRESVRQIKKPKRDLPEDEPAQVSTMVNSHLLTPSEVN